MTSGSSIEQGHDSHPLWSESQNTVSVFVWPCARGLREKTDRRRSGDVLG